MFVPKNHALHARVSEFRAQSDFAGIAGAGRSIVGVLGPNLLSVAQVWLRLVSVIRICIILHACIYAARKGGGEGEGEGKVVFQMGVR